MESRQPYTAPQLFEVVLDPEQAILTACSLNTSSLFDQGNARCKPISSALPSGCKNGRSSGSGVGDSGARLS